MLLLQMPIFSHAVCAMILVFW